MKKILLITLLLALKANAQAPTNGLVAYFNFENNLNSHNNNHGFTNPNNSAYTINGKVGSGISFTNNGPIVNTSIDATMNNAEFTFCFWFKEDLYNGSSPTYSTMLEAFSSALVRRRPGISPANPPLEMYYAASASAWYGYQISLGNVPVGSWNHAALMLSPGTSFPYRRTIQLFINGVLVSQAQAANNTSFLHHFHDKFTIGGGTDASGNIDPVKHFSGTIDELFIYDRMLTIAEINAVKDNTSTLSNNNFQSSNLILNLYPNPAKDILSIDLDSDIKFVEIYSLQGQKVLNSTNKDVNVSGLSKGIYFVKVQDVNDNIASKKLVIE